MYMLYYWYFNFNLDISFNNCTINSEIFCMYLLCALFLKTYYDIYLWNSEYYCHATKLCVVDKAF